MTAVDLIVPTYNAPDRLRRCLKSLARTNCKDFHLVVVDDASEQPVNYIVQQIFPTAKIVRNHERSGLVHGLNRAIDSGSDEFVVLLNDDTEVQPDWLEQLVTVAKRHPNAGSVASKLRLMGDRRKLHSAGDSYSLLGIPVNRGVWLDDLGQYDAEEEIFGACAGAALYRRQALDTVRLANGDIFDSRLFMYCEDVDLSWRLQGKGYACYFAPNAIVDHELSASGGGTLASFYVARNIWLVYRRSAPAEIFEGYRLRILGFHVGRLLRSLRNLNEPATRAWIRGTLIGIVSIARERSTVTPLDAEDITRIRNLLVRPVDHII